MKKILLVCLFGAASLMAADGAALYKKCQVCHGVNGEKVPPGSKAKTTINTLSKDEIVKNLQGYKAKTLNMFGAGPIMQGQAQSLSEDDMKAVADYIVTLKK